MSDDESPGKGKQQRRPRLFRFVWTEAIRKTPKEDLSQTARHAAHVFSDYIDKDTHRCFISNQTLADAMGLGKTQAEAAKKTLVDRGWLVVVEKGGGSGRATEVEARIPTENHSAGRAESNDETPGRPRGSAFTEPLGSSDETARSEVGIRPAHRAPTEGEQERANTTTVEGEGDDDLDADEIRSMVAWTLLDGICKQIDCEGITALPRLVRREALARVAEVLRVCSPEAVSEAMRPPELVRNKSGLIRAMAKGLAENPPQKEEGMPWYLAG